MCTERSLNVPLQGDLLGPALLFFGCRNSTEDYIYADELEEFRASGVLTQLRVAFSREGPQKVYVQHLLEESGAEVWKMMSAKGSRGHVYVCGDAKQMARDVNTALLDIIQKHGKLSEVVAENMIKSWSENGRYSRDVW
jgi:NADPH-ferrihemoprotein reductase